MTLSLNTMNKVWPGASRSRSSDWAIIGVFDVCRPLRGEIKTLRHQFVSLKNYIEQQQLVHLAQISIDIEQFMKHLQ